MSIDRESINKLAKLARLSFSAQEKKEIQKDLQQMVEMIDKLDEVDTQGVIPLTHMTDQQTSNREDKPLPSLAKEEALGLSRDAGKDLFKVVKVIDK